MAQDAAECGEQPAAAEPQNADESPPAEPPRILEVQRVRLLDTPAFQEFWEFATEIRRTKSLAARASERLRGAWVTPELAVQRIHGWSFQAVRLLCVVAKSEERRARLRRFFQSDRQNLEGHLVIGRDALENEPRILIKVPFNPSMQAWVERERRVLSDLQGLAGVPSLADPLFFEDIGVHAATYHYSSAPSLQEQLETGQRVPVEGIHKIWAFMLSTLEKAHVRGWLHTDLQPKDVLLPPLDRKGPENDAKHDVSPPPPVALLCGWTNAARSSASSCGSGSLFDLLAQLSATSAPRPPPSSEPPPASRGLREGPAGSSSSAAAGDEPMEEQAGPSIYSAPEQLVALYSGRPCASEATDVYRAAAIALMALRGRGPFAGPSRSGGGGGADGEAEGEEPSGASPAPLPPPPAEELQAFVGTLRQLLSGKMDFSDCACPELEPCFSRGLAHEPTSRPPAAGEALEELDAAWFALEERLLSERPALDQSARKTCTVAPQPRRRLVLEPPPELEEMRVL